MISTNLEISKGLEGALEEGDQIHKEGRSLAGWLTQHPIIIYELHKLVHFTLECLVDLLLSVVAHVTENRSSLQPDNVRQLPGRPVKSIKTNGISSVHSSKEIPFINIPSELSDEFLEPNVGILHVIGINGNLDKLEQRERWLPDERRQRAV